MVGGGGWLWRVQVNSEQVSFKSSAKTGQRLCDPDILFALAYASDPPSIQADFQQTSP